MTANRTASTDLPVWSLEEEPAAEIDGPALEVPGEQGSGLEPLGRPHVGLAEESAGDATDTAGKAVPRKRSRAVLYFLGTCTLVLAVGLSFAVGRATAPASSGAGTFNGQNAGQLGGGNVPGANGEGVAGGFGPGFDRDGGFGPTIQGTVVSFDGTTLTVKLADGSTVAITTSSSTAYSTAQAATASDVTAGKTVNVQVSGTPGSTTRTATNVTITGN